MGEIISLSERRAARSTAVNQRAALQVATTVSLRQSALESPAAFVTRIVGAYLAEIGVGK